MRRLKQETPLETNVKRSIEYSARILGEVVEALDRPKLAPHLYTLRDEVAVMRRQTKRLASKVGGDGNA